MTGRHLLPGVRAAHRARRGAQGDRERHRYAGAGFVRLVRTPRMQAAV
jgi:hypothetical protein